MVNRRPNIWKLQADKDIDGLREALTHNDPDVRKRAAAALRVIGTTRAIFALEQAFDREENPYVREHINAALSHLDHESLMEELVTSRNVPGLVEMLNSPRSEEIIAAIKALGDIGDRLATEGLVMVFRNPLQPDDVRLAAAEALLKLDTAPAVVTLLGAMRRDDWQVRRNAVTVLGQLRATWATGPLIKALADEHARVRRSAETALKKIGSPRAMQALRKHLRSEEMAKTAPLEDIVDQQIQTEEVPAAPVGPREVVGSADVDEATLVSKPSRFREALHKAVEGRRDDLSPALAAAEAALADLSPDGEALFDDEARPDTPAAADDGHDDDQDDA